jgi:hypothetical protein
MTRTIAALKADIAALQGLPGPVKQQLDEALTAAVGVKPSPEQAPVKVKLDTAGDALALVSARLEGAEGVAEKALNLAKTVYKIGKWVIAAAL